MAHVPPLRRARTGRFPAGATFLIGAFVALFAGLAGCTRPTVLETPDTTLSPMVTEDGPLVGSSATTSPPAPTTEPPLGGSPARLAPLNVKEHDLVIEVGKDRSQTHLVALVPIETDGAVADTGSCYALLWTTTALSTDDLLLSPDAIPLPSAVAGDEAIKGDSSADCDRRGIQAAGWGNRGQVRILPEASFNAATTFFVPAGTPDIGYLVLTGPNDERRYFEANVSGSLPELPAIRVGAAPNNVEPIDPNGERPFEFGDTFQTIDVTVRGVVPDVARVDDQPGSCVSVIGTIKPTKTVGAILNTLAVPTVHLLVDGAAVEPTPNRCGTATLTSNRWYPIQQAGVSVGNTFAFAQSYAVSSDQSLVQGIVIGELFDRTNRRVYAVNPFDSTPSAPEREKVNPQLTIRAVRSGLWTDGVLPPTTVPAPTTAPAPTAAPTSPPPTSPPTTPPQTTPPAQSTVPGTTVPVVQIADPNDRGDGLVSIRTDATWTAAVYGLYTLPSDAEAATCHALLVSWFVTDGQPTDPPPVGLIAGGAYWGSAETEATCDTAALTDAGWADGTSAVYEGTTASPKKVFVPIFLPADSGQLAAIGVGNVADDVNVAYFAPTVISAIPGGGGSQTPTTTSP